MPSITRTMYTFTIGKSYQHYTHNVQPVALKVSIAKTII